MRKLLILIALFILSGCYVRPMVHYHPYRKVYRIHKVPTFRYSNPPKWNAPSRIHRHRRF